MTAPPFDACTGATADFNGRSFILFGGCNYLGLAQHPRVIAAVMEALTRFGLSTSASRETTGNTRIHEQLEHSITDFCGHPAGLLVPDGYIANLAALQALGSMGFRHAVVDARAHASLPDAAAVAGLRLHPYAHRDPLDAARVLAACSGPAVIATDSVFAADGALAPAPELLAMLRPGDRLLLDDCHGLGVFGANGRGIPDEFGLRSQSLIVTTTLAKGLGCAGAIVMGAADIVSAARARSTAYICTTPCSPALAAGAIEAISILRHDHTLIERLRANTARTRAVLAELFDIDPRHRAPIIAFTAGSTDNMHALHRSALDAGVLAPLVEYPGGPAPVYFRLSVSAAHTPAHIDRLESALNLPQRSRTNGVRA
jgi:8-amino-7-oxononanoate synthase